MTIARHHRFRITMGITPRCEYILGALEEEGEVKTSYLRHIGLGYDIIDALDLLERKGLIKVTRPNGKLRLHSLTELGKEYLQQVKEIYQ
jgi:DNA-binding MarR family transcriptional regulator